MVTASAKSKGATTWDVWRQTNAALQGRKSKTALSTADKFVKKNKLEHFVHRTSLSGNLYVTDLRTGEEKIASLTHSRGRCSRLGCSEVITASQFAMIGIDRSVQIALTKKFYQYEFTFEELLYCQENPEFTERLLSETVCDSKLGQHRRYNFNVSLHQLVDDPSLLEPLPGESNYIERSNFKSYSEQVLDLLNVFFQLDYQQEISRFDARHTETYIAYHLRQYVLSRIRNYLIWGDIVNRGLVSVVEFKERHKLGTL